jgi:hypothetical protein
MIWQDLCRDVQLDRGGFFPNLEPRKRYILFRRMFHDYIDLYPKAANIWYRLDQVLCKSAPYTLYMLNPAPNWQLLRERQVGPFDPNIRPHPRARDALRFLCLMYCWHNGQGGDHESESIGLFGLTLAYGKCMF